MLNRIFTHTSLSGKIMLILLVVLFLSGCQQERTSPRAIDGTLNLTSWDFSTSGPVRLHGDWGFSWREFVGKFDSAASSISRDHYPVPGLWHKNTAAGVAVEPTGYATYSLVVELPKDRPETMAVFIAGGVSTYRVWVNGKQIAESGVPGTSKETELPRHHYAIADFTPSSSTLNLSLEVSNFHNMQGGLNGDMYIGSADQIVRLFELPRTIGAFMGGALLCMGLFYLILFCMRRAALENLYFSLLTLCWSVAIVFSPSCGYLMADIIPSLPWKWYITLSMLPYGVTAPLLLLFYHSLFPKKYGRIIESVYWMLGLFYVCYILLTPANAYDPVIFYYFIINSAAILYLIVWFPSDLMRGDKSAAMLIIGYLALGLAEVDDMLFDLNIVTSTNLRPYGVFIFILTYAFFLSIRFSHAFTHAERLSEELESTNVRLLQLNGLKDEFLANTTHELKTPLAGMIGVAESLLGGTAGTLSDNVKDHLRILALSGKRLSKLINDVLDLSRLKHKDIVLSQGPVSLHGAAQRVLALSKALGDANRLEIRNRVPKDIPPVYADRDRLEQVLFNLVGNAIKFTEQGSVTVSARLLGNRMEVTVRDTGIGIPPQDQARIFESYEQRFFQETGVTNGTGLGLSISRHLVELHGGSLAVSSTPGEGSVFTFTLPLADSAISEPVQPSALEAPVVSPVPALSLKALTKKQGQTSSHEYQVLVVDDEPVNLHVVASILELSGISFRTAKDGPEALALLEKGDMPDVILLDVMMPEMSGYAVCRKLREKYTASALPVVMLTARTQVEDIVEGFSAGANDYLTKPFSRDELVARVSTQIKLREAFTVLQENMRLKRELALRESTERNLRQTQARLSSILDSLDEAILAVNSSLEIAFCNQPCETFLGQSVNDLLGQSVTKLLSDSGQADADELLVRLSVDSITDDSVDYYDKSILKGEAGTPLEASISVTSMELEDDVLHLLLLRPATNGHDRKQPLVSARMVQELNTNRQRIVDLEEALLSLESGPAAKRGAALDELKALDGLLDSLGKRLDADARSGDKRECAVEVMKLAVDYWTKATGTTKADLAEQSGQWNVYMEKDGYVRTQTLDKYLSLETLPLKPRWKKIRLTVEFVLAECQEDIPLRNELKTAFSTLKPLL